MGSPNLAAIVVAAGASRRMGFDKLMAPLAGKPLIYHTLAAFEACVEVEEIVLVCSEERIGDFRTVAQPFPKVKAFAPGGRERVESVLAGTAALKASRPIFVAVHDGARPLITPAAIAACYEAARETGAAVCAQPVTDTLHRVDTADIAVETVSRKHLWAMQTPQIMELTALESILQDIQAEGGTITDEVSLLVRSGGKARVIDNPDWNFKVTYPRDLELAEMILQGRK